MSIVHVRYQIKEILNSICFQLLTLEFKIFLYVRASKVDQNFENFKIRYLATKSSVQFWKFQNLMMSKVLKI